MKKIAQIAFLLFPFFFSLAYLKAQTPVGWMHVTSDNGEFSVEVPDKYNFFYDKEGFVVSNGSSNTSALTDVHIFSSFQEKTLISFECYETGTSGADLMLEIDKQKIKSSEISRATYKIKQITSKEAEYYFIRQYYRSKNYLYIVTAASREGETAALKRFLDSIVFDPKISAPKQNQTNFSKLKLSNIAVSIKEDTNYKSQKSAPNSPPDDPNIKRLLPVSKPRVSYVDTARMKAVQGSIAMKVTLNENGFIPEFVIIKSLPEGLLRQSVFAALRMRFLPQEKGDIPQTVVKTIEYHFALY